MLKRYLVFAGAAYYPAGGWDDFVDSFDTKAEAEAKIASMKVDWADLIDTHAAEPEQRFSFQFCP